MDPSLCLPELQRPAALHCFFKRHTFWVSANSGQRARIAKSALEGVVVSIGQLETNALYGIDNYCPETLPRHSAANLPGWCWAQILQSALVGLSSSLHTEVCNAVRFSDGVIHSRIS